MNEILTQTAYLLVLINPVSKVTVLSLFSDQENPAQLRPVAAKSSLIGLAILLGTMLGGEFLLHRLFRLDLHSLEIAGGIVLFWVGFKALTRGVFFEHGASERFADLSIVPLACPLIAGPGTITAALTLQSERGLLIPIAAMAAAVTINMLLMFAAPAIGGVLRRYNILGALIRITGLIIIALGVQMVAKGAADWLAALSASGG
jgi:multiple antibiotic resistance protein